MSKPSVRICADCRHCTLQRQLLILEVEKCAHPRAVDVVTGKAVWDARQLRTPGSRLCGPGGRLWAAKDALDVLRGDAPVLHPSDAPRYWTDSVSLGSDVLRVYPDKTQAPDILTVVEPLAPRRSKA